MNPFNSYNISVNAPTNFVVTQETSCHVSLKVDNKIVAVVVDSTFFDDETCAKWCDDVTGEPAKREARVLIRNNKMKKNRLSAKTHSSKDDAIKAMVAAFV